MPVSKTDLNAKANRIYKELSKQHPDATIELVFGSPLELAVATILSAQCTDVRVNLVTPVLFKKFKRPEDYVSRPVSEIEEVIRSTGFFRQKAKNIRRMMELLIENHDGTVPRTMDELVKLPGIGRKTANVILGNAYDTPGLPVDTHVRRVSNRIGLTENSDPVKIEIDLTKLLPARNWTQFSHLLIFHGRRICKARKPNCRDCRIKESCDYYAQQQKQ